MNNPNQVLAFPNSKKEPRQKKQRGALGGYLYVRKNPKSDGPGVWSFEYSYKTERYRESLGITDDGTALNRELAKTKMATRVAEIRSEAERKRFEPLTVQAMYDAYLEDVERRGKKTTVDFCGYRWKHLEPVFGNKPASQVTKQTIVSYLLKRKHDGAGEIVQNRELAVLKAVFNYNKEKIAADDFPVFPKAHSERAYVRRGLLKNTDYPTVLERADALNQPWLSLFVRMAYTFGFRKTELITANCGFFDSAKSTFTLPPYSTKNRLPRVVPIARDGEIFRMLQSLTAGQSAATPLFNRSGKAVLDLRGTWAKLTEGLTSGSGKNGQVTVHDLRRSAITNAHGLGVSAEDMGTHVSGAYVRYIQQSEERQQQVANLLEKGR